MKALFFLFLSLMVLGIGSPALAGKPMFNQPVKLDQTGRPMYNSWQRFDNQRRLRDREKKNVSPVVNNSVVPAGVSVGKNGDQKGIPLLPIKNSAGSVPTPESVILNRPVQTSNDPGSEDFNF